VAAEIPQGDAGGIPPRAEGIEGARRRRAENRDRGVIFRLMVRRHACAVSNHEGTMGRSSLEARKGAPQDDEEEEDARVSGLMGKITGFLEIDRHERKYTPVAERVQHFREFVLPLSEKDTR